MFIALVSTKVLFFIAVEYALWLVWHIQIGYSNSSSTQTRASRHEVMLEECLTEQCSNFKSVFKHVSQPLLDGVDSQV